MQLVAGWHSTETFGSSREMTLATGYARRQVECTSDCGDIELQPRQGAAGTVKARGCPYTHLQPSRAVEFMLSHTMIVLHTRSERFCHLQVRCSVHEQSGINVACTRTHLQGQNGGENTAKRFTISRKDFERGRHTTGCPCQEWRVFDVRQAHRRQRFGGDAI